MARLFFRSKWVTVKKDEDGIEHRHVHYAIYRRPKVDGEVKGKSNLRHAKRLKVRYMKNAGHLRGDNRPFAWPPQLSSFISE